MDKNNGLYSLIEEMSSDDDNILVTLLTGPAAGEKCLLRNGSPVWTSPDASFLPGRLDRIRSFTGSTALLEIDGESLFLDRLHRQMKLVICGAGYVGLALLKLALCMGIDTVIIDDRSEYAGQAQAAADALAASSAGAGRAQVICRPFGQGLREAGADQGTYFVFATRGHHYDSECILTCAALPHAYLGLMGSRSRTALLLDDLQKEGLDPVIRQSIHTPVGLAISAQTPEEIAVSILAEIIQEKNTSTGSCSFPPALLKELARSGRPAGILAAVVRKQGSAPRQAGTRMLILSDGTSCGTIGGGAAEGAVIAKARSLLAGNAPGSISPLLMRADMTGEQAYRHSTKLEEVHADQVLLCGGIVDVFLEEV